MRNPLTFNLNNKKKQPPVILEDGGMQVQNDPVFIRAKKLKKEQIKGDNAKMEQ